MRFFFLLLVFSFAQAVPSWRSCSFCQKIIDDTNEYFGKKVTSATDVEFAKYFQVKCPKYVIMSPIMEITCEEMVTGHPKAVFSGLRSQTNPEEICKKCEDCI